MDSVGVMDIPGYRIVRKIGQGAMASVFLAVQTSLGRRVALKILAPALAAQKGFTTRFLNEGRIIAYLKHPQIVNVYDLGSHQHDYYLAMEFLSAGTLEQRVKEGIGIVQSMRIVKQIAMALKYAHQQGVIHRDIKPQNILFRDDDLPVLTDFGIARLIDGGPHLTIPGRTMGSPLYMSPEQVSGHRIDQRADLYALGILFYKMLTRKLPYESDQIVAIALMHKAAPIPVLPDDLSAFQPVLNNLLAKNPDDRFASAQEVIDAFAQIESKYPLLTRATDSGCQQSAAQPAEGRINLLDACQTHPPDDSASQTLEHPYAVDTAGRTLPAGDQATMRPDPSEQEMKIPVPATVKSRAVWKRGAVIAALLVFGVGLTLAIIGREPFTSWPRPASHPVAPITAIASRRPLRINEKSNLKQPVLKPSSPLQGDPAGTAETTAGRRTAVDNKIAELQAVAQEQLARYHLTLPAGDNSYETYRQILALDPSSRVAESISIGIGQAYRRLALGAKAKGRLQQGMKYVDSGLRIRPEDSSLLALQSELNAGIAEQNRFKIEQQERRLAAEHAAIEDRRKAERELGERKKREAKRVQLERQRAEQEEKEQPKARIVNEEPDTNGNGSEKHTRLFGTF